MFSILYGVFSLIQLIVLFLLPSKWIHKIYRSLDAKEEEKRIESLGKFVREGDDVLDIGAGSGRFGKIIQEKLKVKVTGVDVCDYSDHTIPFFVYDGTKLPFPDKTFDIVFFAFVLHHTTDHAILMKEACRVSRRHVVIFEDTYEHGFERLSTCWNDYHTNILQGWIKARKGYLKGDPSQMPMPFTFRSVKGWVDFFSQFPVKVMSSETRKMGYKPLSKTTFCLAVNAAH